MKVERPFIISILLLALALFSACSPQNLSTNDIELANPSASTYLSDHPSADIFLKGNIVYKNAEQIDWIKDASLKLGKKVMTINKVSSNENDFENGTATKLSVGTEVYEPEKKNGHVLIAVVNGEKVPYIGLIEG